MRTRLNIMQCKVVSYWTEDSGSQQNKRANKHSERQQRYFWSQLSVRKQKTSPKDGNHLLTSSPKPLNSFSSNNTYQVWLSVTVLGVFHLVVVPGTRFQSSWVELKMRHQQTACHRLTTPSQDSNLPFLELGKRCASMMRCRRYHHLHVIHCLFCGAYKWHHRIFLGRVTVMIPPTLMWCSTAMEKDRVQ